VRCGCSYEWGVHVAFFAERVALTPEQIRATVHGTAHDPAWSDEEKLLKSGPGFPEADFASLEGAGNRLIEISRTVDAGRLMRLALGLGVPSRDAVLAAPIIPAVGPDELARHAARAREHEDAYESELRRLYGYDVVTRNCVTEIFRTIDAAFASRLQDTDADRIRLESTRRLGGYVEVD
jgi:hypothetical protein